MPDDETGQATDEIDRLRRGVAALEALLDSRDRRLRRLRDRLRDERLRAIWLDGEVARRDSEIGELRRAAARPTAWRRLARRLIGIARRPLTPRGPVAALPPAPPVPTPPAPAPAPAEEPETPARVELDAAPGPLFSILLWGDDEATWASLRAQSHTAWEAIPVRGDPTAGDLGDPRGRYLIPLEAGDLLEPDALARLSEACAGDEGPDLLFWNEAGAGGRPGVPKPGWSPTLLLSEMYLGRAFAIRRDRFEALGGYRSGFGTARHHDLVLRLADGPARVVSLGRQLSRRRPAAGPCPAAEIGRGALAVQGALERRGVAGRVSRPGFALADGRPSFEIDFPEVGPGVALLIPTRDRVDLIRRCVESILERTAYRPFRVVVVDNDSGDPETLDYLRQLPARDGRCSVVRIGNEGRPFSYARINNRAVAGLGESDEYVVFLNNDTEARRPEWLAQMVGYGGMPGVGAVGARLLFPDGRVQHAGMTVGLEGGLPGHDFKLAPWWDRGPGDLAVVARDCAAATAACLLTRRSVFLGSGGFDEDRFAVAFNDVDYCLRLGRRGLRTVYAPRAELIHHEGATRGFGDDPAETSAYLSIWGDLVDPYVNPCFGGPRGSGWTG